MKRAIAAWLKIWLFVFAALGATLVVVLIAYWDQYSWITRLTLMSIITIILHVWEEERIPGGFLYMFNTLQKSPKPDRYPMNEFVAMIVDYSVVIVFIAILIFSGGSEWFGITIALFCLLEVTIHSALGLSLKKKYHSKGKRTIYTPGTATAIFGFLPIAVGMFYYLVSNDLVTGKDWLIGIGVAIAVFGITVKGFEEIFKDENAPYISSEKHGIGYFRKFLK
jgi:hypothetical protein